MKKFCTAKNFCLSIAAIFMINMVQNVIAGDPNRDIRKACETIGTRIARCYTGSSDQCDQLKESNIWFANQFGASPELLCPSGLPLVKGR